MPIMSYLAYPVEGETDELFSALQAMPECEVHRSDNRDLLVLVTDTTGKEQEDRLQERLKNIDSLALLALVSGFSDPDNESGEVFQNGVPQ